MDYKTINYIDRLTEKIIETYDIQIPVQNIKDVVASVGGAIIADQAAEHEDAERKDSDNAFTLIINDSLLDIDSYDMQRRIGMALGHVFLHMGYRTDLDIWTSIADGEVTFPKNGKSCLQATYFYHALKMPKFIYIDMVNKYTVKNIVDIKQVAEYFCVAEIDVINRGRFLGVLEW